MAQETIDYAAVLADLEARRNALDQAIAAVRLLVGQGAAPPVTPPVAAGPGDATEIPSDAFLGMSISDAARKFLIAVKRKQSTRQISEALQRGGLHSTAKDFTPTLYTVLSRQDDIVRVGKDWGMASWFPGLSRAGRKNIAARSSRKRTRSKRKKKPVSEPTKPAKSEAPGLVAVNGGKAA